jgi:hypothetical protein
MSNRKKSKKNGSGDEEEDPKHRYIDPRTRVTKKLRENYKTQGLANSKRAKKRKEKKVQKAQKELREQERWAPEIEPVVEPGNELQNKVLETVPEGENRVESPEIVDLVDSPDSSKDVRNKSKPMRRLSSSSQSGSDVDRRRKAKRTPSPSGSDDDSEQKAGSTSSHNGSMHMKANLVNRRARAALMTRKVMIH